MPKLIIGYIGESELARDIGVTVFTLRSWRKRGYGPAWAKFGRLVFYREQDVRRFLDDQADSRGAASSR